MPAPAAFVVPLFAAYVAGAVGYQRMKPKKKKKEKDLPSTQRRKK